MVQSFCLFIKSRNTQQKNKLLLLLYIMNKKNHSLFLKSALKIMP